MKNEGKVRTDMHCSECSKGFIAELNYDIDGNHIVECPHCAHEHCRVITNGEITDERWDTRQQRIDVDSRRVWKHDVLQMKTSTASHFIREKWIDIGVK